MIKPYLVFLFIASMMGLFGAAVSTFYEDKLVAGFAAGSSTYFVMCMISYVYSMRHPEENDTSPSDSP